jgi:hypothetical protein
VPKSTQRPSQKSTGQSNEIPDIILDCVRAIPGKLPRSGIAKLLVGSESERVKDFRRHPLYNRLAGHSRSEILHEVDQLLIDGLIMKNENGYLVPGNMEMAVQTPSLCLPEPSIQHPEDPVAAFLSQSHPRPLQGPWQVGWALGFHSQFAGANWNRSKAGELAYRLKYQSDFSVLPELIEQAVALIAGHPELTQVDAIVPVPPSKSRPNDPVSSFARTLAQRLDLAFWPALTKSRQTAPQKEMRTLAQKRANIAGAFDLQSPIRGKRLLVVDDLFDSGATLEEITRLLQHTGAAQVNVLTLTRTIHSDA